MKDKIYSLNNTYSTTKLCSKLLDDKYLDENGKIKEIYKFKLNFPEFGIIDSKIPAKEGEKFDTYLFLPEGKGRKDEGGLRTKGYFKFSYEKKDNDWYIVENEKLIKRVNLDENIVKGYEKLPLMSIITIVFNGEKYLEETIQSVINQTYPNVEYIIIDGGSTDGTLDIIKKYEDYIDYWVSEKDNGIYDAMNKGLKLAVGDYISILNADDFYEKEAIEKSIKCILKNNVDYSFAKAKFVETNTIIKPIYPLIKGKIYQEMPYPHVTALIAKKIYKDIGLFNSNFKIAGDHDIAVRINLKRYKNCYLNRVIAYLHEGGISNSFKSNYESMKVSIYNGKNVFLSILIYIKQILKLMIVKNIPLSLLKKLQRLKGSRFAD